MEHKLTIKMMKTKDLLPYANNARIHSAEQVDTIAKSIEEFSFNDPIGVWTNEDGNLKIVEGHGRVMAAEQLGLQRVPTINLDHLTDEQRRAYSIVHNQTTDSSVFDFAILESELDELNFEWEDFGVETVSFDFEDLDDEREKTKVVCTLTFETFEDYEPFKEELDNIADRMGASLAVKMA